jgi:dihydrodiol dehydrogenase / D-xylose 1-dehydrogenase (NADP)
MANTDTAPLRWGILGCGRISHTFASNVKPLTSATLHACAARSLDRAEVFAKKHGTLLRSSLGLI